MAALMRLLLGVSITSSCAALCLPGGVNASNRKFIKNSTGHDVSIGLHEGAWATSDLFNQLMLILIEEGLGYHAHIDSVIGASGASPIYALAGCTDFDDANARRCGEKETEIHVSIESWIGSYKAQFEQMNRNFPESAAFDLGSLGYEGEESIYLTKAVLDAAYNDSGLALDFYKSYNPEFHNPGKYFSTLASIPTSEMEACSSSEFSNSGRMQMYKDFSGDAAGVIDGPNGVVANCFDGYWWAGPACRGNSTQCFPVITVGGWKLQAIMQWVAAYSFPAAVGISAAWSKHGQEVKSLFYWWVPDSTFIDLQPKEVIFPRHSALEWAKGNKRTGAGGTYIAKLVSRTFPSRARKVTEFIQKMTFELAEVDALLLQMTTEPTYDVVCRWAQENQERWKDWVPVVTQCFEGFGLVNAQGTYVTSREEATGCDLCPAGTSSQPVLDIVGQTFWCEPCAPGYSQPLTFSTACEACPRGSKSGESGSTQCNPCEVSTYQNALASTTCLACDASRTTKLLGAASVADCVCREGLIEQNGNCVPCGEGLVCPVGSTVENLKQNIEADPSLPHVVKGYFSTAESPLEMYLCRSGCPGGAPGVCDGGLVGLTCGECPNNFYKSSGECRPCGSTPLAQLFWIAPVIFVVGTFVAYYLAASKYQAKANSVFCCITCLSVALTLFQNMGVLGTISLDWPASTSPILGFAGIFLLDLEGLGMNCVASGGANRYTWTAVFFFLAVATIPTLGLISRAVPLLRSRGLAWKLTRTLSYLGGFLQASFTTIASLGLMPFMCYKHPTGDSSLLKHSNVFCGSADHQTMAVFGALLLTVVFSFFCLYVLGCWVAPRTVGDRLVMWNFVLHRFRPSCWWFGLVILARGTLVSVPAVVATNEPSVLITLMLCVQQMYLVTLLAFRPWKAPILNLADGAVTSLLVVLLALALEGLDESSIADTLRNTVTISIVITLALMFLLLASVVVLERWGKGGTNLLNLRKPPKMDDVLKNTKELADFLGRPGSEDKVEDVLQRLCYYDYSYVIRCLSILSDELELEVATKAFTTRVTAVRRRSEDMLGEEVGEEVEPAKPTRETPITAAEETLPQVLKLPSLEVMSFASDMPPPDSKLEKHFL